MAAFEGLWHPATICDPLIVVIRRNSEIRRCAPICRFYHVEPWNNKLFNSMQKTKLMYEGFTRQWLPNRWYFSLFLCNVRWQRWTWPMWFFCKGHPIRSQAFNLASLFEQAVGCSEFARGWWWALRVEFFASVPHKLLVWVCVCGPIPHCCWVSLWNMSLYESNRATQKHMLQWVCKLILW